MVVARESIDVDFRGLSKHGIFRDLRSVMDFDDRNRRVYDITLDRVTDVAERPLKEKTTTEDANTRFRIGDPDHTISGPQSYRLLYRIGGALNAFDDHDELYWNATGIWPVTIERATATVHVPAGALTGVRCFQGNPGSRDTCTASIAADKATATFAATRPLVEGQQMTIVAMLAKNAVHVPPPSLTYKPRVLTAFFDRTPTILSVASSLCIT
jgi:hypothetical protein